MSRFARTISFLTIGLFILESKKCSGLGDADDTKWWETTLVYQISPAHYEDSDGDGVGDIQGIISRLDYIEALGVETIRLNPIYPSPLVDSGYDVSDYKNVNPVFGHLCDFDKFIKKAHARDIKVILDFVPNHTSDKHKWFMESVNRVKPYTDYYIWAKGSVNFDNDRLPPNNWMSNWADNNSSAWTYTPERDQWYYHKFHESEPDLNLDNPAVRGDIMRMLEFWLDRGVDGFCIIGVPYFYEDPYLEDEESPGDQIYTFGEPRNVEFLYDIRAFVDDWTERNNSTSKYLITGTYDTDDNLISYYGNNNTKGVVPLNYCFIKNPAIAGSSASAVEMQIEYWLNEIPSNSSTNWALSDQDSWRIASRAGPDRLDALHMLSMLLPGQAFTYYGDEIGMLTPPMSWIETEDSKPFFQNSDDCDGDHRFSIRTAMQWDDSTSAVLSASPTNHSLVKKNYVQRNVAKQLDNPRSHLSVYKRLAKLRKDPVFVRGDWKIESLNDDDVLVLQRTLTNHPVYVVVINLANVGQTINMTELYPDLNEYLDVVVTSGTDNTTRTAVLRSHFHLLSNAGIVLKSEQIDVLKNMEFGSGSGEKAEERKEVNREEENEEEYREEEKVEENEEKNKEEEFNEMEYTMSSVSPHDNPDKTMNSSAKEESASAETENPNHATTMLESGDYSFSGSDALHVSLKLATSMILGIVMLTRAW